MQCVTFVLCNLKNSSVLCILPSWVAGSNGEQYWDPQQYIYSLCSVSKPTYTSPWRRELTNCAYYYCWKCCSISWTITRHIAYSLHIVSHCSWPTLCYLFPLCTTEGHLPSLLHCVTHNSISTSKLQGTLCGVYAGKYAKCVNVCVCTTYIASVPEFHG